MRSGHKSQFEYHNVIAVLRKKDAGGTIKTTYPTVANSGNECFSTYEWGWWGLRERGLGLGLGNMGVIVYKNIISSNVLNEDFRRICSEFTACTCCVISKRRMVLGI